VVCKLIRRWATPFFSTFFVLLTACGQQLNSAYDAEAEALGREARVLSMNWLNVAYHEAETQEVRNAILEVKNLLEERHIVSPPSEYAATCNEDGERMTAAFVAGDMSRSDIYVCPQSKRFGKIFLAQVLIHEALHLRGERDECEVTRLEILVMTSALRIPYKNAYVDACGLDS
jgi:hypothetical protein